jgi:hypothetical protein
MRILALPVLFEVFYHIPQGVQSHSHSHQGLHFHDCSSLGTDTADGIDAVG